MGFKENWCTKEAWFGEGERYNYGHMCIPNNPFKKGGDKPKLNFYGRDEPIPIMLSLLMGLQHCFAMVGGLVTPPLVIFRFTVCGFPFCPDLEAYAVSAALITSGICSFINVSKGKIPFSEKCFGRPLFVGSGGKFVDLFWRAGPVYVRGLLSRTIHLSHLILF